VYRPLIALVVLAATYLGLALGRVPGFRVDRTGVAIIGATAMMATGVIPWDAAVAAVDAHTLVLLFGMMVIAAYLRLSGFFDLVIERSIALARTPVSLLAVIIAASGVLSALFVNDVVCLVLAPLVLQVTKRLQLPPVPYLLALATAANVGSVATVTGNPQNMLVASFSGIGYLPFLLREGPIAVVGLACVFAVVWLTYRRELRITIAPRAIESVTVHYPLMTKTLLVVAVMLVAFLTGVPVAVVAISGAAYSLLTRRVNPEKVYREIDWGLLVLFTGLFVVVGGVESSGLADDLLKSAAVGHIQRPAVLMMVGAVLSNIVSNVPAVLLLKPVVLSSGEPTRSWLLLATASTLAGNLTILGSVANVIVVEVARRERIEIGFVAYCRVGIPLTILTLLIGWLFLVTVPV
jgi:Na+/H+ antiporter NhaD/arsenite permease-like protein